MCQAQPCFFLHSPFYWLSCIIAGTPAANGCDRIKFGHHCVLGTKSIVQPAAVVNPDGTATYAPLTVGSFVHIGCNVNISALAIGSHVLIGDSAVLGNGVDVRNCVIVTSGSVVNEGTILPSHTGALLMMKPVAHTHFLNATHSFPKS
jgi:carbonic anhydrase/acetyltransferase-like protein (isoleucine patch superfamily)